MEQFNEVMGSSDTSEAERETKNRILYNWCLMEANRGETSQFENIANKAFWKLEWRLKGKKIIWLTPCS